MMQMHRVGRGRPGSAVVTASKGGPSLTDHHVRHILEQKETVAGFQGETRFCPVGIFVYVGFRGGLLCAPLPVAIQLHGGEYLRKSTQRIIFWVRAKSTVVAIHDPRLGG